MKLKVEHVPLSAVDRLISYSVLRLSLRNPGGSSVGLKSFLASQTQDLVSDGCKILLEMR